MAKKQSITYEEVRQRKLEENKKKLEELNLHHLSIVVQKEASPKTSEAKQRKRRISPEGIHSPPRRSRRLAQLPETNYHEVASDVMEKHTRVLRRTFRHLYMSDRASVSFEDRLSAQKKAEEIESQLDPKFRSFVKSMMHSHVIRGFWLTGLSGGWQGFAIFHELIDGDALVFQLIKPTMFKVYIVRATGCGST
ncbi:B3 domain-containing protein Os03g0184500-like isoform X2 [Typha latifolia]|uniref:B3 domain-containing protein Os03g0184500-like isoform X2 n=1 Tax=Typha latifolia TaxID=4733 RepID=UPI003C2EFECB